MAFRSLFHSSPKNHKKTKQYHTHNYRYSPERDEAFSDTHKVIAVTMFDRDSVKRDMLERDSMKRDMLERDSMKRDMLERDSMKRDMLERDSMKRNILDTVSRRSETVMGHGDGKDNPMYEDPKDVLVTREKPPKPPRKRMASSPAAPTDTKSLMKEQRRQLTKRYEGLITTLIQRCEDNVVQMSEKDSQIAKLKEKLKTVLGYNRMFADENDKLKTQHEALVKHVEECKGVVEHEKEKNRDLEERCKELEERVGRFEMPDRDEGGATVPLVEVCMSCSRTQIALSQAREQAARGRHDLRAMKDVLYRLNIQLSRYQEKLRQNPLTSDCKDTAYQPGDRYDGPDSLVTATLDGRRSKSPDGAARVDVSGLLSAQALAPLFDAYQENLQEKDSLILDYEKQFENINKKSKEIVTENKSLSEKVNCLEEELGKVRQSYKRLVVEKETADIEKATLVERAERAEFKLKEVYECYEDKMSCMMRDYETVHREYFAVKHALEATEGRVAQIDVLRARTVPADLHERRLDHCKRLLEELKHQYNMESERKAEQSKKVEQQLREVREQYSKLCEEHQATREELRTALKNVKLYRKAASIFRSRARAASARLVRSRRGARTHSEPLKQALDTLARIKQEIKMVKTRAQTSLEQLERRIVAQERRAALAAAEHRREIERASLAIEHKEQIIRRLIDQVAEVEEVRLSLANSRRQDTQGIASPDVSQDERKQAKPGVKLVPGPGGGYFQEKSHKKLRNEKEKNG